MAQAQERGRSIKFDVLYYANSRNRADIIEEIGAKEGEYIRKYMPPLNTQIPKEENWRSYTINSAASNITVDEILRDISIN